MTVAAHMVARLNIGFASAKRSSIVCIVCSVSVLVLSLGAGQAVAADTPAPGWAITSTDLPTSFAPGGEGEVVLEPLNIGATDSSGEVVITDTLPAGVTATDAGTVAGLSGRLASEIDHTHWDCQIAAGSDIPENSVVTCHNDPVGLSSVAGGGGLPTGFESSFANRQPFLGIDVELASGLEPGIVPNAMAISGGGALAPVHAADPLVIASGASSFGLARWDGWLSDADGTFDTTAGSVPYAFTTSFDLATLPPEEAGGEPVLAGAEVRNLKVDLPPGLLGNPNATPTCAREQFELEICPPESIIGVVYPALAGLTLPRIVFNIRPPAGLPAEFGFEIGGNPVLITPSIRTGGDYGISTAVDNIPRKQPISSVLVLWGVPNDPSHDRWRSYRGGGCTPQELSRPIEREKDDGALVGCSVGPHPALKPFLRMPTSCSAPGQFSAIANGWSAETTPFTSPQTFFTRDADGEPSGLTGCNQLPFEPSISAKPTTNLTDAPTGLNVSLEIPQPEGVGAIEEEVEGEMRTVGAEPERHEADLKDAVVTLPEGVSINPASANGLAACTPGEIGLTSAPGAAPVTMTPDPAECPNAAKIGSVEIRTPLLSERNGAGEPSGPHLLKGGVYVASPEQNPFGSLLAIYIAVDDPATGTVIKLSGLVEANQQTGQLTASFDEDPQLPFEDFHLEFFGGAGAALRTPALCGEYKTTTTMTPWSTPEGADAHPGDSFAISQSPAGGICPTSAVQLPSAPSFTAGTIQPKAGAYSPFVLHLARADGTQEISQIDTTLPAGLIGKLAGIGECTDAQIAQAAARDHLGEGSLEQARPSCPQSSEVGTVTVGAGAGPTPYYVTGHAYLAGPYKGAPLSLEVITPAVAGPYDLGTVAVRTALYVNEETTQIHAVSDPFPRILQGIPLDLRQVALNLSRPDFTLNPTSCEAKQILGSATSTLGSVAAFTQHFQVGECSKLGFKPKLALKLKGGTKRNHNPALTATLTYPKGAYANIASAQVTLPHSEFLDQAHIGTVCTRVQFVARACPAASVYGYATAITPLLDQSLSGPVYLRSSSNPLPDLVADLNGQIEVTLDGKVDTGRGGGIRNTFQAVPDAPVSKFVLSLNGGKKGLLVNSENICSPRAKVKAIADFTAQNGKVYDTEPVVQNQCKKAKGKHKGHRER